MSVRVNKAGTHNQVRRVNDPLSLAAQPLSDLNDLAPGDPYVSLVGWRTCSIDYSPVFDQKVKCHDQSPFITSGRSTLKAGFASKRA
jgi:hypothetical protein